jgi:hypothetical protein
MVRGDNIHLATIAVNAAVCLDNEKDLSYRSRNS